MVGLFCTAQHR